MEELFWITRLSSVKAVFIVISIILAAITAYILIDAMVEKEIENKEKLEIPKKLMLKLIIPTVIFSLLAVFTPTTKEALIIYGVGGTIDYIENNETAKRLPDKVVKALDKYLDEINNNN